MPRPKRAIAYDQFKVSLPPELAAELRLRCFSPLHVYGAPKGAISALFSQALREFFERYPLATQNETNRPDQASDGRETPAEAPAGGE